MNSIYVSFNLKPVDSCLDNNVILDKDYQAVYKPLAKFLYSHPNFEFSFSFTGPQLTFFKKRRTEFITILKEMVDRKQVEILGGGYYDPVIPLLYQVDRNGQIDMLSAEIRQTIGKRPRGITLFADGWDSSLVNSLQTCGIEYVLLDSTMIQSDKKKFLPLIMSDLGKSVEIFPYYTEFNPQKFYSPKEFVLELSKRIQKIEKKDKYTQLNPERIININLDHKQLSEIFETKWFDDFDKYLTLNPDCGIKIITPSNYKKNNNIKVPCYISSGINSDVAKWMSERKLSEDVSYKSINNLYDFMHINKTSHALYNRIMFISMLVNQYKNDKMRKNAAREKLWQAQNGAGLFFDKNGLFSNNLLKQQAYKNLMEADKILREDGNFKETISTFDYDEDGINDYVCRMQNYFAFISLVGGSINELDFIKNSGNYALNNSRIDLYDGYSDDYQRNIFVDHLFSNDQFDHYINDEPAGNGIFSKIHFTECKFSHNHKEIQIAASAIYSPTKQKVYLRKKYIINSDGLNVQYILRNESDRTLNAKFGVESNFANPSFNSNNINYFNIEIVNDSEKIDIDSKKSTKLLNKKNKLDDVELVRVSDLENGVSFSYEASESCTFYYSPIIFKRPNFKNEIENSSMTSVVSLFWDINIEPFKEIEKNINFTISSVKKVKQSN